jgi:hypothetical protein
MRQLMARHVTPHEFHGESNYDITASETPE